METALLVVISLLRLYAVHFSFQYEVIPLISTEQEDDVDFGGGSAAAAKKTKFSRLSWGLEIWDLLRICIELMYEPELQVKLPASQQIVVLFCPLNSVHCLLIAEATVDSNCSPFL
jgi:hypothetical protein